MTAADQPLPLRASPTVDEADRAALARIAGGELAALVVIEATTRFVPGVLGNEDSPADESYARGLLEYPQFTRPAEFRGHRVPDVLLSGDHAAVERWRAEQAARTTRERRPDLLG